MIQKGDAVIFVAGKNQRLFIAASDTYEMNGELVVDLHGLKGEVDIRRLAKLHTLFEEDF